MKINEVNEVTTLANDMLHVIFTCGQRVFLNIEILKKFLWKINAKNLSPWNNN